jgi:hypothetical protein
VRSRERSRCLGVSGLSDFDLDHVLYGERPGSEIYLPLEHSLGDGMTVGLGRTPRTPGGSNQSLVGGCIVRTVQNSTVRADRPSIRKSPQKMSPSACGGPPTYDRRPQGVVANRRTTMTAIAATTRSSLAALLGASVIALGGMLLTTPTANALNNLPAQCAALGGEYDNEILTDPVTGEKHVHETCCYKSLNPAVPGMECDDYFDGNYVGNNPTPPTTTPQKHPTPPAPGRNIYRG